ncbi:MAG: hypothetical protein IPH81_20110 [Candidatus Microthrix sp.]|nr:hypothetical protein [Candidatus Microthrix sp.]
MTSTPPPWSWLRSAQWLNATHPGLKAPSLGLQLRRGNSLIGARRATWKVGQLKHRPWAETRKGHVQPPTDRPLTERLATEGDTAEVHHFLLPGHGWGAVADRKEAKELRLTRPGRGGAGPGRRQAWGAAPLRTNHAHHPTAAPGAAAGGAGNFGGGEQAEDDPPYPGGPPAPHRRLRRHHRRPASTNHPSPSGAGPEVPRPPPPPPDS